MTHTLDIDKWAFDPKRKRDLKASEKAYARGYVHSYWSSEELRLMKEAVLMYGVNYQKVWAHMGKQRTKKAITGKLLNMKTDWISLKIKG